MKHEVFELSYVPPSYLDYIKSFREIPQWKTAVSSHKHYDKGPMTQAEYDAYLSMIESDDPVDDRRRADAKNRKQSMTTLGWFLYLWVAYFKRLFEFTFDKFRRAHYENALNDFIYKHSI